MNRTFTVFLFGVGCAALTIALSGCSEKVSADPRSEAPPAAKIEQELDANLVKVDHPDQFPLVPSVPHASAPELNVTGVVSPDVSRNVPVPSLATGRVVEIDARLGDVVKKGQILFKVQSSDIAGAFSDYRKAVMNQQLVAKNEQLTKIQLDRAKLLFEHGAIPKSQLEIAELAEVSSLTAIDSAKVDLETTTEHLKLLGSDTNHPSPIVEVPAPVAGVITDQQVTGGAGIQALSAPNPFTISDLSKVWIVCDVYENDLASVHLGEFADIHLNAYPNQVLRGRISNIGAIMDPNLRTAKVRLEVDNPGLMRIGMFVTATFHGQAQEMHAAVPATSVLHLHDRDWIYVPAEGGRFRRVEVTGGNMLPGGMQEIVSGIKPGQQVVSNALVMQNTVEQ
jgi:cobalt-zinc-cadmium efflux system membrane fusion protein